MTRYFSSFIITFILYSLVIGIIFYSYSNQQITIKEKVEKKRISLKHIEFVKKVETKPLIIEKKIVKPIEKIVKQKKAKIQKKKIKPKKVVEKKIIKKEEAKVVQELIKKEAIKALKKTVKNKASVEISPLEYKKDFLKKNLLLIKKHIQNNVKYSKRAREMNIQGNVLVEFSLSKNGMITKIRALSGHKLLRKSTIKAIHNAATLFPKVSRNITIKIPISYKLI